MSTMEYSASRAVRIPIEDLEEDRRRLVSLEQIERAHLASLWLSCLFSMLVAMDWMGRIGHGLALGLGIMCLFGLIISQYLRVLLGDLYRQFHYREKFALFVFHLFVILVPRVAFGIASWELLTGILLVVFCFQAINPLFFGRILFLNALLVFLPCAFGDPAPNVLWVAGWFVFFLLAIRMGHLAHRIESFGEHHGLELGTAFRKSLTVTIAPAVAGYSVYILASQFIERRSFQLTMDPTTTSRRAEPISMTQMMLESLILVVIIVGALLLLQWLDQKLRRRRGASQPEEGEIATTLGIYRDGDEGGPGMVEEQPSGARERILAAFRRFSDTMGRLNQGRREQETAEDFFARLCSVYTSADRLDTELPPFNKACYSDEEPTDAEAGEFTSLMDDTIQRLRDELRPDHSDAGNDAANRDTSGKKDEKSSSSPE